MNILVINADEARNPGDIRAELPHLPDIIFSSPAKSAADIVEAVRADTNTAVFVREWLAPEPEGESDADLKRRVMLFISEIEERYADREALVVTHAAVVRKMHDLFSCDEIPSAANGAFHDVEIY